MTRPVQVLFVAGSLGGGGAERRLIDLLNNLNREKIAPRLYLAYRRGELLPEAPPDVPITAFWDGESRRSPVQQWLARLRCPSAARAMHLREVLRQHPVDVIMSWSLLSSYETALARLGRPVPQLASIVAIPKIELEDAFPRRRLIRRTLAGWTYRSATSVLVNSAEMRDEVVASYRLSSSKVDVWLNARDFARIERLAGGTIIPWSDSGRRVIAAGRLIPLKGFDLLLRAVARVHQPALPVQLTILGQGPEETALRRLASELGIAAQVRFLGFQANPFAYYRSADAFVLSSRFEGMPNTLIEAMACRVPVIATSCPTGPREILEQGKFGKLIPVDDVVAMAEALRQILSNPPPAEFLAEARQSVLDRYGIGPSIVRLESLLCAIADRS